ncbi:hypothetical protein SAMN05444405_102311 [Bacteroides luti]|uniref:Uncharacterized protein n=1 Tax=Bacteroides luti TaxID=1297750 RepID=A0A1M4VKS3_9BACE|nr:hypothetical protein [Bacteroides luti]SHE69584.1 hypothetical protein SAMN05444405_102311 [Bacteroides luti]
MNNTISYDLAEVLSMIPQKELIKYLKESFEYYIQEGQDSGKSLSLKYYVMEQLSKVFSRTYEVIDKNEMQSLNDVNIQKMEERIKELTIANKELAERHNKSNIPNEVLREKLAERFSEISKRVIAQVTEEMAQ